jgi:hypothetical protein
MTPAISPFKVTADDLEGLDKKTRDGIQPLLDALNASFNQVVAAQQAVANDEIVQQTLTIDAVVADAFPFVFKTTVSQPRFVSMVCNPRDPDHVLTTPFVMQGFSITDQGLISIPAITGLLPANEYALAFWVR